MLSTAPLLAFDSLHGMIAAQAGVGP
jgi:hypothetical protein